ncbi:hypothetical protein [Sphingobacterium sp. LRF_L2]|uniref:hypothetical protein n=1 Tax=Sphingobacterium sp. LRF_L2 TaxID=3369421 RepID=UPI003F643F14
MTDNANFPAPSPALAEVQTVLDDFAAKLSAARKRGSPEDTALKDETRPLLEAILQKLAYYVNSVANGQISVLLSSGFATNSESVSSKIPLRVEGVRLADGRQSGQARLDFNKLKGALLYEYQYKKVSESEWSDRLTTTSSRGNILAPLDVAERYEVRVRGVNTQGSGDWSDTSQLLVR